jgi:hypothetical protein
MADPPVIMPTQLKPVSLTGETWERLRQAAYAIPEGQRGALILAGSYNAQGKPQADLLLVQRLYKRWYVMGSIGYAAGGVSADVAVTTTW